jgi:hypothetical protein
MQDHFIIGASAAYNEVAEIRFCMLKASKTKVTFREG